MTQFPAVTIDLIDHLAGSSVLEQAIVRSVSIATPDTPVSEAIALMGLTADRTCKKQSPDSSLAQPCKSCVLVVEATQLVGIFTERDAVKLTAGIDLSRVQLSEVMTRQVITLTLSPEQNILTALALLDRYGIHHLPILDRQAQLLGIVTPEKIRQALQVYDPLETARAIACLQQQMEQKLQAAHDCLAEQVKERTAELASTNARLLQTTCDRQQAQERIQFQANILSQINEAVIAIDRQHCVIYWNQAAEQFYGLKADAVLEQHIENVIPDPWFTATDVQAAFAALTAMEPQPSQHIRLERSRKEKFLEVSLSLLKDDRDTAIGLLAIVRDISDRHRAEEALHRSEEQRRLAIDLTHIGSWDWQLTSGEVTWNENHFHLLGLVPGETEASYQVWRDRVHPEDIDRVEQAIALALETRNNYEIEYRVLYPDGSLHWLLARGKGLYNTECKVVRIVGVSFDISDRVSAEQKIREQASLLDITADAICVRDLENCILYWNKGAQRLYGWQIEEVVGRNAEELYQRDLAQTKIALRTVIEAGEWQGELRQVTKAGSEVIVTSRWTLIRDKADQPKSILVVDTDITQKKQLEAQLLRTQRLENLGILAGGIAHDLNNILTPILAVAQLLPLKLTHLEPQNQYLLAIIADSAKRGAHLVKQILTFARGTEEKRTLLQVKHLLLDVESMVESTFPKSIEIKGDIPDNLWTVAADATQLHQVLMNLAVNARDAMPNGGKLSISAANRSLDESYARMNLEAKAGDYVVIIFADTGIGIPPDIVERIFDPFFTTKAIGKGTGLGLSTVHGIIKSHGGFVEVDSEVGKGTQFRVFLPAEAQAVLAPALDLNIPKGSGELVLIVDDETTIAEITKNALETHNYRVLIAHSGIEAIALYALHKYEIQVVLLDLMMPEMSGNSVIGILQKMNPQVQILAMSGSNPHLTDVEAGKSVQDFLSKPFTTQELLTVLQRVIQKSKGENKT